MGWVHWVGLTTKARLEEMGVSVKNRTIDLVAGMPWAGQSLERNHTTAQAQVQEFEVAGQSMIQ